MKKRCSGILMPVSSLPGGYGIGSMGQAARDFVDFLAVILYEEQKRDD